MKRIFLSYFGLILLLGVVPVAKTATSYIVHNVPEMRLNSGITAAQTAGIELAAPRRNGESVLYPTTTGGILLFEAGQYSEYVYYGSATLDYTTKDITLVSAVRGYCWNSDTFASCEDGRAWGKGTRVTLVNDMRLFNRALKVDRANTCTASGCIKFSGSGSFSAPTFASIAVRNTQIGATPPDTRIACVTSTGTCYYYIGGQWISFGSGSTVNATESIAGKVELADTGSLITRSFTGSTGASNVVYAKLVTQTGGLTSHIGMIPILNFKGVLRSSLGGTGSGNLSANAVLLGNGSSPFLTVAPGANNNVLVSNGTTWTSTSSPSDIESIAVITKSGAYSGYSTTDEHNVVMTVSGSTSISSLAAGDAIHVKIGGSMHLAAGASILKVKLDGNTVCQIDFAVTTTAVRPWEIDMVINIREVHAAGIVKASGQAIFFAEQNGCFGSSSNPPPKVTFDNTGAEAITVTADWSSSNAANAINIDSGYITLQNTP